MNIFITKFFVDSYHLISDHTNINGDDIKAIVFTYQK